MIGSHGWVTRQVVNELRNITETDDAATVDPCESVSGKLKPILGLRGRLLALTVLFVLIAELLIFPPSAPNFRNTWLEDRLQAAEIASLAIEAAPDGRVSRELSDKLRDTTNLQAVAVIQDGMRELIYGPPDGEMFDVIVMIDLSSQTKWQSMIGVFGHLFAPSGRYLRILDTPAMMDDTYVEIIVPEKRLKSELLHYSWNILVLSLLISAVTGGLVYLAVYRLVVRPMMGLTRAVVRFRDAPDHATPLTPSGRRDEIGRAEMALQDMQETVSSAFRQRSRLAELGEAVAKINHDLRNSLAVAQIVSDSIQKSDDPRVRQAAPRLERALQRAVGLAQATLTYGRETPHAPSMAMINLHQSVEDAMREGLSTAPEVDWINDIDESIEVYADRDDLHRIVSNLARNAGQAYAATASAAHDGLVSVSCGQAEAAVHLEIRDNGPGIPDPVLERLFQPFSTSSSRNGSGLGLAISRELARGMGGDVELVETGVDGTVFRVVIQQSGHEVSVK